MDTQKPIIDTDWIHFLDTGESQDFLSRVWMTKEEYCACLLDILPDKTQQCLDLERDQFLQLQEDVKRENRQKEVLEFAQWRMQGNYELIFLYRLSDDGWAWGLIQDAWNALWEALSRLSDEEKEIAIMHCRSICLSLEIEHPDADFYKWAKTFFEDFDFRSGIPSMPSQYVPGEPLMQNKFVRLWTEFFIEWTQC